MVFAGHHDFGTLHISGPHFIAEWFVGIDVHRMLQALVAWWLIFCELFMLAGFAVLVELDK